MLGDGMQQYMLQFMSDPKIDQTCIFLIDHWSPYASTMPFIIKSKISSFLLFSVVAQPDLCQTWSETQNVGFLTRRLLFFVSEL